MVDTPFFENRISNALEADDIARAVRSPCPSAPQWT